jgi:endo-1,4-beta-xylanase
MKNKLAFYTFIFFLNISVLGCNSALQENSPLPVSLQESVPLKQAYADWFAIGVAIPEINKLSGSERQLLFNQFGTVTPENGMKPNLLHPEPGRFVFDEADSLVNLAVANGLKINGHTLVWYKQNRDWFELTCDSPDAQAIIRERIHQHIFTVVQHWAGRVSSWDVWNEGISDIKNEYFRKSKCTDEFTYELIFDAFSAAHQADPSAQLFYTDYNIEYPTKREKALRLIKYLKERGAPVFGVGIQAHYTLDKIPFNFIKETLEAFDKIGVKVAFTELDIDVVKTLKDSCKAGKQIDDPFPNGLPDEVNLRLANQYAKLFTLFVDYANIIPRVSFWALHNGKSWLNHYPCDRTNHPMLWDRELQPTQALKAVLGVAAEKKIYP